MFSQNKRIKNYLEQTYKKEDKNTFIIEIDLNKYTEVFSEWDKSNLRIRDIHPELEEFLNMCSEDIPLKYKISIHLYLPLGIKDEQKEQIISNSIKNYYNYCVIDYQKKIGISRKGAFKNLFISFFMIFLAYIFKIKVNSNLILKTINEVFIIGSWVFMWEFFSSLFFSDSKLKIKQKEAERFINSNIVFKYEEKK